MSPQLNYSEQAPAFAGMLADNSLDRRIDTALNGDVVSIAFGRFVVQVTPRNAVSGTPAIAKLPAATGDDYGNGGFVVQSNEYDKRLDLDATGILVNRQLNVLKEGRIWVFVEQAMLTTDPIFVRYTTNGALVPGNVRKDDDTTKAKQLWGARLVTATTGAGLAELHWDSAAYRAGLVHS